MPTTFLRAKNRHCRRMDREPATTTTTVATLLVVPRRVGNRGWPDHEGRPSGNSPESTGGSIDQTPRGSPGHREDPVACEIVYLLEVHQQGH